MKQFLAPFLLCLWTPTWAATLVVDINGQLTGALGVSVGSEFFDVEFIDGVCADLFNGCNEASDLSFPNEASALSASAALLEQVFVGDFDSDPELTRGCESEFVCDAVTTYASGGLMFARAQNQNIETSDNASLLTFVGNTSNQPDAVYVVWSGATATVPLPAGLGLFAFGIAVIGSLRSRVNGGSA